MSDERNNEEEKPIHYEAGVPIFGPVPKDKDAQERADRKAARSYEDRQISIQKQILWTQIGLVVFGLIGGGIGYWQAHISKIAADAAVIASQASKSAADTAAQTLVEMRSGSGAQDTHTLALQAVTQATQTTNLAKAASTQATQTTHLADTSKKALTTVQRAFLTVIPGHVELGLGGMTPQSVQGFWENIGSTPATKAWMRAHFDPIQEMPGNYPFAFTKEDPIVPFILGAHMNSAFVTSMPKANLIGPQGFWYGWVVYDDIFKNTPPHLTEFCGRVVTRPYTHGEAPVELRSEVDACPQPHSCFDTECADYKERTKEALASQSPLVVPKE